MGRNGSEWSNGKYGLLYNGKGSKGEMVGGHWNSFSGVLGGSRDLVFRGKSDVFGLWGFVGRLGKDSKRFVGNRKSGMEKLGGLDGKDGKNNVEEWGGFE